MIKRLILPCLLLVAGCERHDEPAGEVPAAERIVSMAPNITEIIYALGLQDRLAGATTFCLYPPAAQAVPRVGGFGQFNYEAIVSLDPDLVILHREFEEEKSRLQNLGIPTLVTDSFYMEDIFASIRQIGAACGAAPRAEALIRRIQERIDRLPVKQDEGRPDVLIVFGGSADEDIGQVHAFGTACLHHELLERAGGRNVLDESRPYVLLSREAVLRLDPDMVIVLAPELETREEEQRRWAAFPGLRAAEEGRIHILTGDYLCIPGPRFIRTLEDFSRIILENEEGQKAGDM